ncbi:hypothetical protein Vwe01_16000 [Micromonospora andamanensis]|nr:hypothetical protein Vwe01_16000 [Micromonospora andamanensis]
MAWLRRCVCSAIIRTWLRTNPKLATMTSSPTTEVPTEAHSKVDIPD